MPNFTVRAVVAQTIADIRPGDKVGITSVKGPDGTRQAVEIHMFPATMTAVRLAESLRDRGPNSLMTNALVAEVGNAPSRKGQIKITLNGKESELAVLPGTLIVTYVPWKCHL